MNRQEQVHVGIRFTEEMAGFVTFGERDHERGAVAGRRDHTRLMVHLRIRIDDLDRFEADPDRAATIDGWVDFEALGGILPIEAGTFNLLVDGDVPGERRMRYRLHLRDGVGHPVTLSGTKRVGGGGLPRPWRIWRDTTTLATRVVRGHVDAAAERDAEIVASGILRLSPGGFLRQLATFRASGPSLGARIGAIRRFDALFLGELWRVYGPEARHLAGRLQARLRTGTDGGRRRG